MSSSQKICGMFSVRRYQRLFSTYTPWRRELWRFVCGQTQREKTLHAVGNSLSKLQGCECSQCFQQWCSFGNIGWKQFYDTFLHSIRLMNEDPWRPNQNHQIQEAFHPSVWVSLQVTIKKQQFLGCQLPRCSWLRNRCSVCGVLAITRLTMRSLLRNHFTCGESLFAEKILARMRVFAWSDLHFLKLDVMIICVPEPRWIKAMEPKRWTKLGKGKNESVVDGWLKLRNHVISPSEIHIVQRSNKTCYTPNGMKSTPNGMKQTYIQMFQEPCMIWIALHEPFKNGLHLFVGDGQLPISYFICPLRRETPLERVSNG